MLLSESVANICNETLSPSLLLWSDGVVRFTTGLIVQLNVWLLLTVPFVAATSTVNGPLAAAPGAMVPEIKPVVGLRLKPSGRPLAL